MTRVSWSVYDIGFDLWEDGLLIDNPDHALRVGMLVVLDRDRAKQVFGARDAATLYAVVRQLADCAELWSADRAVRLGGRVEELQQAWDNCAPADEMLRAALAQTLLGGRPLADDGPWRIRVVRPDVVPVVADALATIQQQDVITAYRNLDGVDSSDPLELWLDGVRHIYTVAASERSAVMFASGTTD